jgi:cytochrome c biogenesis protein CcmG/thiol:disulfide interchange protein DsbE
MGYNGPTIHTQTALHPSTHTMGSTPHHNQALRAQQTPSIKKRWALFLATISPIAAIVALLAWGIIQSGGNPDGLITNNNPGEEPIRLAQAPPFTLTPILGGPTLNNQTLSGKIVLVDFWSSWCPPCRAEAAALAQVYREYAGMPVEFVGVAIWDETGDVQRHLNRYHVTYPNALDERGLIAISYGVRGIPEKYFLDRQGNVVRKFVGSMDPDTLRSILDELLSSS